MPRDLSFRISTFLIAAVLYTGSPAAGQTARADRFVLNTGPCVQRSDSGSPEGVVTGNACDSYIRTETGQVYFKVSGTGSTGWYPVLGATGATCTTFAGCAAGTLRIDALSFAQRFRTDPNYQLEQHVTLDGGAIQAFNASGWMPLKIGGGPTQIVGGGFHIGQTVTLDPGVGNADVDGYIGKPGYVSQTIGWRIDGLGAADFRYLYADELHARKFIADLEQALAGLQIIAKSVGQVGAIFTVPAPGSISTLVMKDLPSAENMAIFEAGDTVWIRTFSRAGGGLDITNAFGTVSGYVDLDDGLQSWQFTRLVVNGGAMATDTQIPIDSIVLDVGVSGNGWVETNAIDGIYGINSPYTQVVTWSGNSPISGNQTLRTRLGNLRGITGVTGEYGLIAGTYAATNGRYFRASNQAFELHGIDLSLWNGATRTMFMEHSAPYFSMGNPAPTTYAAGAGCWSGMDAGAFKWRCGDIAAGTNYISWDGASGILNVKGNIIIEGSGIDADTVVGVAGATVVGGAARGMLGIDANGLPSLPHVATPSGSGLFLGSNYMGFFTGGVWKNFLNNAGDFYLGGTGGALQFVGSTGVLTIAASLSGNGSGITSIDGGHITANTVTTTALNFVPATSTNVVATINASAEGIQISGARIAISGLTTFSAGYDPTGKIAASGAAADINAYATTIDGGKITAHTITTTQLYVTTLSAITANLGTVNAGTVNLGGVTLNSNGLTLEAGWDADQTVKWDNGAKIMGFTSSGVGITIADINWFNVVTSGDRYMFRDGSLTPTGSPDLGESYAAGRWRDLFMSNDVHLYKLAGGGTRALCVNNDGIVSVCP